MFFVLILIFSIKPLSCMYVEGLFLVDDNLADSSYKSVCVKKESAAKITDVIMQKYFGQDGLLRKLKITNLTLDNCCNIKSLDALFGFETIEVLSLSHCKSLEDTSGLYGLSSLRELTLSGCEKVCVLPDLRLVCKELCFVRIDGTALVSEKDLYEFNRSAPVLSIIKEIASEIAQSNVRYNCDSANIRYTLLLFEMLKRARRLC